jgi:hypothetical protein
MNLCNYAIRCHVDGSLVDSQSLPTHTFDSCYMWALVLHALKERERRRGEEETKRDREKRASGKDEGRKGERSFCVGLDSSR